MSVNLTPAQKAAAAIVRGVRAVQLYLVSCEQLPSDERHKLHKRLQAVINNAKLIQGGNE